MNTYKPLNFIAGAAIVAATSLLALNSSAFAQEKGAEHLVKLTRVSATPTISRSRSGEPTAVPCPKCKDVWVRVAQPPGKGGRAETAVVAQHQCSSCRTRIGTIGVGKQATASVTHVCEETRAVGSNCCVGKNAGKGANPVH